MWHRVQYSVVCYEHKYECDFEFANKFRISIYSNDVCIQLTCHNDWHDYCKQIGTITDRKHKQTPIPN